MPLFTSGGLGLSLGLVVFGLDLGLVSSGLGLVLLFWFLDLKNLVLFTSLLTALSVVGKSFTMCAIISTHSRHWSEGQTDGRSWCNNIALSVPMKFAKTRSERLSSHRYSHSKFSEDASVGLRQVTPTRASS